MPATLLIFVNHQAAPFVGDRLYGHCKLVAAIATQRPEYLSREALRMDSKERNPLAQIAHDERERGFNPSGTLGDVTLETDGVKHPPLGRHLGGRNAPKYRGLHSTHCLLLAF